MAGNTGCQMGGWFNKEINSADDLKGLKMRIPGLGGDVMAKLGASPVSLPGGQIYENLVSGAIDATEWVGPWNDSFMKFYEAAKYYYYPGMHEPGSMLAFGMNKSWWEGLSKTDQLIIEGGCRGERYHDGGIQRQERRGPCRPDPRTTALSCVSSTTTSMTASAKRCRGSVRDRARTAIWRSGSTTASAPRVRTWAAGRRFRTRPSSDSATACSASSPDT